MSRFDNPTYDKPWRISYLCPGCQKPHHMEGSLRDCMRLGSEIFENGGTQVLFTEAVTAAMNDLDVAEEVAADPSWGSFLEDYWKKPQ